MSVILGIISSFLRSFGNTFGKAAVDNSYMKPSISNICGSLMAVWIIFSLLMYYGINTNVFFDYGIIFLIFGVAVVGVINKFLILYVYRNEKLSTLLPYDSLDKVFIVIFGFVLFYGTEDETSITTLLITLLTIFVIFIFSVDLKKISFPKTILVFFLVKVFQAFIVLGTSHVLLKYSNMEFILIEWLLFIFINVIIALIFHRKFKDMLKQPKAFYSNRFASSFLGWTGYLIGLYIIQTAGVVIATLLGFFSIAASILAMKLITGDTPNTKQVSLAVIVLVMIGIGFYFR